jgi:hypothetical protein
MYNPTFGGKKYIFFHKKSPDVYRDLNIKFENNFPFFFFLHQYAVTNILPECSSIMIFFLKQFQPVFEVES